MTADSHERQRLEKLLHHLQTKSLADVPADLLLDPLQRTRPGVRLVAHYTGVRQVTVRRLFGLRDILRAAPVAALAIFIAVRSDLDKLAARLIPDFAVPRIEGVAEAILSVVFVGFAAMLLGLVAQFVLGRITWERDSLILDLNELSHQVSSGLKHTPWSDVYTAEHSLSLSNWSWVTLEHGDSLACRLRGGNCDVLVQIMRELIRHHHSDLYGQEERNQEQMN